MEILLVLFLAMLAIGLLIELIGKYWFIAVGILLVYLVAAFVKDVREKKSQRLLHLVEEGRAKAQRIKDQREAHNHAVWLLASANELLRTAAHNVWDAEVALDRAESEFAERAFAPFWDAVETAANRLAQVHEILDDIAEKRTSYQTEASNLGSLPSTFALEISSFPNVINVTNTANRMAGIVRLAQKDFQFSTIFEQRKTNQLLVQGFGTLASALAEMTDRLEMSLSELGWSLFDSTEAIRESSAKAIDRLDSVLEQAQSDAQAHRTHEAEELETLKDIERKLGNH